MIDFNGDKILNSIKIKLKNDIPLTEMDAYFLAVLPFTKHEKDIVEFAVELIYWVNEVEISEEFKYIIKMSQILWVNALIDDENLTKELMDVIKMRSTFIQEYERNLVESAVESAVGSAVDDRNREIADHMKDEGYSANEILKFTGVDISKK